MVEVEAELGNKPCKLHLKTYKVLGFLFSLHITQLLKVHFLILFSPSMTAQYSVMVSTTMGPFSESSMCSQQLLEILRRTLPFCEQSSL